MFENLGHALALVRELRRFSQIEVARRAGIGKSQLSKYEGGKEHPKLESLEKVLNVLGVGPVGLFTVVDVLDGWAIAPGTGTEGKMPCLAPRWPEIGFPAVDLAFQSTFVDLLILQRSMLETVLRSGATGRLRHGISGQDFGLASRD